MTNSVDIKKPDANSEELDLELLEQLAQIEVAEAQTDATDTSDTDASGSDDDATEVADAGGSVAPVLEFTDSGFGDDEGNEGVGQGLAARFEPALTASRREPADSVFDDDDDAVVDRPQPLGAATALGDGTEAAATVACP